MKTKRYKRGAVALFLIIINFILMIFFSVVYPKIRLEFIRFGLKLPYINYHFFSLVIVLIIGALFVSWSIRNYLSKGYKYAFNHYRLDKNVRKQLIDSGYYIENKNFSYLAIPNVVIELDDDMVKGQIMIENSIKFDKKLEGLRLNASIPNYIVTQKYLDKNGKYYIYSIVSNEIFNQRLFDKEYEYISWANSINDDYSLKLTDYETIPIHHMGIAAQTGGGKSFLLQTLIIQIVNKNAKHELYIIDPKRADLFNFSIDGLNTDNVADKETSIELLEKFYNNMKIRQDDMQSSFKIHKNIDYTDLNLPAHILIIDEFAALKASWNTLDKKSRDHINDMLENIVFMGRQLGFFMFVVMQRFSADSLPKSITEQLVVRIVLGDSDDLTYRTLFSQSVNIGKINLKPGMGYLSCPGVASIDNPALLVLPFCGFLKTGPPQGEATEGAGYGVR